MIQINQCRIPITYSPKKRRQLLERKICEQLHIKDSDRFTWEIHRRSIDARKKPDIYYVYSLWVKTEHEAKLVRSLQNPKIQLVEEKIYPNFKNSFVQGRIHPNDKGPTPVVIGAGPAGLFAAFLLTEYGCPPLVLDRGKSIRERRVDVERFWRTGLLDPNSNVLFGEGGAGTFSDGKLNTSDKDRTGRIAYVLKTFARFGAPNEIIYDQKPHIGTDLLTNIITSMRQYLEKKGCRFQFETTVEDFSVADGRLQQILCTSKGLQRILPVDDVILAIGHSSRDTFCMLERRGIPMEAKNFAVGFRVEHPQKMMDEALYGKENQGKLPAAPYKLTANFPNGRSVYSFCMCPGGYVVNASSESHRTVVNGMSYSARDGANANSAIVVSVTEEDFYAAAGAGRINAAAGPVFAEQDAAVNTDFSWKGTKDRDPLIGIRYQMALEEAAYHLGSGSIPQQLLGDYRQGMVSHAYGNFASQTKGTRMFANLREVFSDDIEQTFLQGMDHFGHIIPGFDREDAILSGVESRTSSPVRILRDADLESTAAKGLYPCGEGAGYAGGIVSAAVDGLRVAEAILRQRRLI